MRMLGVVHLSPFSPCVHDVCFASAAGTRTTTPGTDWSRRFRANACARLRAGQSELDCSMCVVMVSLSLDA